MENPRTPEKASVQKTLIDEKRSASQKYRELFIGERGLWASLKYEIIIMLFSWIPGALGLLMRRFFYPFILGKVGKGVIFGRSVTLRHPHKIIIGSHSFIDDYAVLDAKGAENEGIVIGKNVFIGRSTILSCKEGSIFLDDYVNISAHCSLLSETRIKIGRYSFLAGHCYLVAGGNHLFDRTDIPIMFQPSEVKGGIVLEEDCWLGASAVVLDGVTLGRGSIAGAGAVVSKSFKPFSVALGNPAVRIKTRGS